MSKHSCILDYNDILSPSPAPAWVFCCKFYNNLTNLFVLLEKKNFFWGFYIPIQDNNSITNVNAVLRFICLYLRNVVLLPMGIAHTCMHVLCT